MRPPAWGRQLLSTTAPLLPVTMRPDLIFQARVLICPFKFCVLIWDWTILQILYKMNKIHLEAQSLPICCRFAISGLDNLKWVGVYDTAVPRVPSKISCYWYKLCPWIIGPRTGAIQSPCTPWSKSLLKQDWPIPSPKEPLRCFLALTTLQKAVMLPRTYKRTSPDLASESTLKLRLYAHV